MKSERRFCKSLAAAAWLLAASMPAAQAVITVNVAFSGGGGTSPLTVTLLEPTTFTLLSGANGRVNFHVVLDSAIPSDFFNGAHLVTPESTLTYTVNGGAPIPFLYMGSGAGGAEPPFTNQWLSYDDVYMYGQEQSWFKAGDVITLSAGTITSVGNMKGVTGPDGPYQIFLAGELGMRISEVPEPGAAGLLILGGAVGCFLRRKIRQG